MQELDALNAKLPRGIKAAYVKNKIHYAVRSSIRGKKVSLGTFLSLEAAIKALTQFKLKVSMEINPELVADEVTNLLTQQAIKESEKAKIQVVKHIKATPIEVQAQALREYVDEVGPHIIEDASKPMNIPSTSMNATMHISADAVKIVYNEIFGLSNEDKDVEL
jgi:hypothetical protein